ncbi:hypothetical protein E2C01_087531 [Portunus trituberculatus]|uniref:Uncharacterized protein n=1 Tax=Portunus trituberculatus TaxID=210409 RepID=A0A5B7J8C6_PORTR|nr:hypothetical protein [Portunus trituberculatus]
MKLMILAALGTNHSFMDSRSPMARQELWLVRYSVMCCAGFVCRALQGRCILRITT